MFNSQNRKQPQKGCDGNFLEASDQLETDSNQQVLTAATGVAPQSSVKKVSSVQKTDTGLTKKTRVVIIGAGLAGLAAAQRLYESNIKDVIVLDAQDRIGGRVHTISHSDYLIELGAQWLHGADQNPLYQWLLNKEMLDDFEDASLGFKGLFCTNEGEAVDLNLVRRVIDILCECKYLLSKNRLADLIDTETSTTDDKRKFKNARQVFRSFLEEKICKEEHLSSNIELVDSVFEWFLRYETIENCCDNMDEVSISSYTDWTDWGDGTLLNFRNGYRCLLNWFCNQFPANDWIHLSLPVTNVEMLKPSSSSGIWCDELGSRYTSPMLVKYKNANGDKQQQSQSYILCDHVIMTASLGFLKHNYETFFKPRLPESKVDLIKSIGFGTVNKIILQFERPFWFNGCGIKLVWKDLIDNSNTIDLPEWSRDILSFDVVRRQPNLLIGWIGGQGAKSMEQYSDDEIGQVCLRLFKIFLPETHLQPSRLVKCLCSRWNSNKYICGSYSFQSVSSFDLNTDKLQEPLYSSKDTIAYNTHNMLQTVTTNSISQRVPRVLFAGEATAGKLYSTTHGAIITGWREADRLMDYLTLENNSSTSNNSNINLNSLVSDAAAKVYPSVAMDEDATEVEISQILGY